MVKKYNMTIGGEQISTDDYAEIRNPANVNEVVGLSPMGSPHHVNQAMDAARTAFKTWRHSTDQIRSDACWTIARVIKENEDELAALLTAEQGKPFKGLGSYFELQGCAGWSSYTAGLSLPMKILEDTDENKIEMHREPLGVVTSITPWNWPLLIATWHIVPAIRTGNTVVIKPSPFTPLSTLRMIELIAAALPPGVINVVAGGDDLGAFMTEHPAVDKIVFTGSIPTGKKVMTSAAKGIVPVTLELGGNDAGIILPGTDPTSFIDRLFWGAMINSGQTCGALKRLYVHESDYQAVSKALIKFNSNIPLGNGAENGTMLGPVQNKRQFDKVSELVEYSKNIGGDILSGGAPAGGPNYMYPVTFVGNIEDGSRLVDEEQFGPVLPIIQYSNLEEAIERANGTNFGLDASVWGTDENKLRDIAAQLEAGTVFINKHAEIAPHVPLGGIKCSGIGVEFGQEGLEAYTSIKVINAAKS